MVRPGGDDMNSKRTMQNHVDGGGPAIRGGSRRHGPGMGRQKSTGNGDAAPHVPAQQRWAAAPPLRQAAAELDGSNWSALTATELNVAELLAAGLSVGAVAQRLDLSRSAG